MAQTMAHQERTEAIKAFLNKEHFRFRQRADASPGKGDIVLTSAWRMVIEAPATTLVAQMASDFRHFCREGFGLELAEGDFDNTGGTGEPRLVWQLEGSASGFGPLGPQERLDPQDPAGEAFTLSVSEHEIVISAKYERGLLHGTHFIEWAMADRGGPFLPQGERHHRPAFMPRLSNGVFIDAHQTLENPGDFPDEYLSLMSHYGNNGIHLYISIFELFHSTLLPELNPPDFEQRIESLRAFARRLERFGIDLYLQILSPPLDESHPVFQAHPEVRGAKVEIFLEETSGRPWYNLCGGHEKVLGAYEETVEAVFNAAPELAGSICIIGGEAFYHCFTRPEGAENGSTNCPHCKGKSPSAVVARLVNGMAAAVKRSGTRKSFYAWPYSAFIWSSNDPAELGWIEQLSPDVSVLSNFDCGDEDCTTGGGAKFFDYNIKCVGPSTIFAAQAAKLQEKGQPIYAKVETNTTPDLFFMAYLPVHYRWLARVKAMRETGVAGYVGQWRFFGMNGTPPEEWQYKAIWSEGIDADAILRTACARDFGVKGAQAELALKGWRKLSDAFESYPYSAMTSGERASYMRGPLYLGPAHPFIFDVQSDYDLPAAFRLLRGDVGELSSSPEELEALRRRAKPRYISDLLITLPFGTDRFLELIERCCAEWEEGARLLHTALDGAGKRAQMELDFCDAMASHFATVRNVVRFYQARDALHATPCGPEEFKARLGVLAAILDEEIANAEAILPALEREPRIGYGHCYGPAYDAGMVRAKIRQCRFVKEKELPRVSQVIRFHVWLESP